MEAWDDDDVRKIDSMDGRIKQFQSFSFAMERKVCLGAEKVNLRDSKEIEKVEDKFSWILQIILTKALSPKSRTKARRKL